jgi:hypothetical protein
MDIEPTATAYILPQNSFRKSKNLHTKEHAVHRRRGQSVLVGSTFAIGLLLSLALAACQSNPEDSSKDITAFGFVSPAVPGTISGTGITATMPYGTDLTKLVATFTTTGASVKVGDAAQSSGTTVNDFTSPVTYTVVAADKSTQAFTVTVTVESTVAVSFDANDGSGTSYAEKATITCPA